jgi:acetyltransferase
MSRSGLLPFFEAEAVAVIGASADPSKVGGSVLANLKAGGFSGRLVPVNSARPVVQGLAAVPSILEVSERIDLAVVAIPAPAVLSALKQCVTKGVPAAVVISAGFREAGDEGRAREAELRAWLRDAPLRLVGPNCLGWIRPSRRLNLTFAPGMPPAGALGFFSHSGALGTAILDWSREHHLGFSLLASLGNQADVNETDVIAALADDPDTRVILGYLEGVVDGRTFFAALAAAAARKPCVLMKAGRSLEGARSVVAHRCAGRLGPRIRRRRTPSRRPAGRHAGGAVRRRPRPGNGPSAPWAARDPPHQRRRSGHPGDRRRARCRPGRVLVIAVDPGAVVGRFAPPRGNDESYRPHR